MGILFKIIMQFIKNEATCFWSILLMFILYGCVEPYEGTVKDFDDVLVVNAIITNEYKRQEVLLTRSYRFEDNGPTAEKNATVIVLDGEGGTFNFEETEPGKYLSVNPFAVEIGMNYSLSITTVNGNSYASNTMQLPVSSTTIGDLYAERITNNDGIEGMGIFVDSFDPLGKSFYYRHEYEETYIIIAPFWTPFDLVVVSEGFLIFGMRVILREREEKLCYGTDLSNTIILHSTKELTEDRLSRYNVRFIDRDNYILSYRYSILVKQYVQTPEAFSYYETLKGLSQSSENIFSEDQPGFLAGNIFSLNDSKENVAGFFEIATVTEKRIFFNYEDFFPGEELPPFLKECDLIAPSLEGTVGSRSLLNAIFYEGMVSFYDYNRNPGPNEGPYLMVRSECGDCTTLGSNRSPDFWIE
ncbi:MAG: hypothetical protein COB01_11505 [Lutibacter sp.]|nr:MAG: hypothetical protein COB01_11505 [Lutibacter sp.]